MSIPNMLFFRWHFSVPGWHGIPVATSRREAAASRLSKEPPKEGSWCDGLEMAGNRSLDSLDHLVYNILQLGQLWFVEISIVNGIYEPTRSWGITSWEWYILW